MFLKLFKHEWKSVAGTLVICSVAALGVGVIGAVLLNLLRNSLMNQTDFELETVFVIFLPFVYIALIGYLAGAEIFLFNRFYREKFTDRGYLTFTLPVRSWKIFLSSALNIALWTIVVMVVFYCSMYITFFFGMNDTELFTDGYVSYYLEEISALQTVSSAVSFLSGIVVLMSCITLGAKLAKKHKIMAAIGIYYGISIVQNVLSTVILVSVFNASGDADAAIAAVESTYICEIIVNSLMMAGGFWLSTWLMEKKLNLP